MAEINSNPVSKWIILLVIIGIIVFGLNKCSSNGAISKDNIGVPDKPKDVGILGGESEGDTLRTIAAKQEEFKSNFQSYKSTQEKRIAELKAENEALLEDSKNESKENKALPTAFERRIADLEGSINVFKSSMDSNKNSTKKDRISMDLATSDNNPLSKPASDEYIVNQTDEITWTYPIDRAVSEDGYIATAWLDKADDLFNTTKSTIGISVDDATSYIAEKTQVLPYITIPKDTSLLNAELQRTLIGLIPKNGAVENAYGFKASLSPDSFSSKGWSVPDLNGVTVSGYAVGNYGLSCVSGTITAITFIFDDGRIHTTESDGKEAIGVLFDDAGNECIEGKLITNAPEYITTNVLMGSAIGAANAYAQSQVTTSDNASGSNQSVTGSNGSYVMGNGLSNGLVSAQGKINELWENSFDAIYVGLGRKMHVEITKEIAIDYDMKNRKVSYENQDEILEVVGALYE